MYIRRLTHSDQSQVKILLENKNQLFKLPHTPMSVELTLAQLSNPHGNIINYGVFSEDKLIGITKCNLWQSVPYYTIVSQYLLNPEKSTRRYKEFINLVLNRITAEMESEERFTYYTSTILRPSQIKDICNGSHEKFKLVSHIEAHRRYDCYIETIIHPHTLPANSFYQTMIHGATWPVHICIKRFSLKYEFRRINFTKDLTCPPVK